jgi:hypothetical protein
MAEDDTTKDLPAPKPGDTQPNLQQMIEEYFGVRDELMTRFAALESSIKTEIKRLGVKIEAQGNRLGHFEEDLVEIKQRVTQLEERP